MQWIISFEPLDRTQYIKIKKHFLFFSLKKYLKNFKFLRKNLIIYKLI
jgi:hypothetical protein